MDEIIRELEKEKNKGSKELNADFLNRLISTDNITFDFSKNFVNKRVFDLMRDLSRELKMGEKIKAMFFGDILNFSEKRGVLHPFLRGGGKGDIEAKKMILENKKKMYRLSLLIRSGQYLGYSKKKIKNIVHIGIGGSEKGIKLLYEAFQGISELKLFFISNVDGFEIERVLRECLLEETIFIYCSKSGKTEESFENASYLKKIFLDQKGEAAFKRHFFGVSSNIQAMLDFGLNEENILEFPLEVGGRFSIFSPISFASVILYGEDFFERFLKGARSADEHFFGEEWGQNIPFIMGSLSWWYTRFFDLRGICLLPYSTALKPFIEYYQQLEMESNGKNLDIHGKEISRRTTNIVWGDCGTNAQHSFFQYLCQTKDFILGEFIGIVGEKNSPQKNLENVLASHFFCQMDLFFEGFKESPKEAYKMVEGGKPVFGVLLHRLTPEAIGELLAFYEHRVFIEGLFHEINSFDQKAVEIGKRSSFAYREENKEFEFKRGRLFKKYLELKNR